MVLCVPPKRFYFNFHIFTPTCSLRLIKLRLIYLLYFTIQVFTFTFNVHVYRKRGEKQNIVPSRQIHAPIAPSSFLWLRFSRRSNYSIKPLRSEHVLLHKVKSWIWYIMSKGLSRNCKRKCSEINRMSQWPVVSVHRHWDAGTGSDECKGQIPWCVPDTYHLESRSVAL